MLLSWRAGRPIATDSAGTIADGIAVREPVPEALALLAGILDEMVAVDDDRIVYGMRLAFDTPVTTPMRRVAGVWALSHAPTPAASAPLPTGTSTASIASGQRSSSTAIVPAPAAISGSRPSSMKREPAPAAQARAACLAASKSCPISRTSARPQRPHPLDFQRAGRLGGEDNDRHAPGAGRVSQALAEIAGRRSD
jgi:hypothetical protein